MKVNIKHGKEHTKIDVKIERPDTWGLDTTLAHIILPCLVQLKESMHGVPTEVANVGGEDYEDQKSFDFYYETHQEAFNLACQNWNEILDKMIWSFQQIAIEDYDKLYSHGEMDYDWVESDQTYPNPITGVLERTFRLLDKNPNDHWVDNEGRTLHEERIQEGLNLFAKYYRALWD